MENLQSAICNLTAHPLPRGGIDLTPQIDALLVSVRVGNLIIVVPAKE
jgi:hypothetical protein